MEQNENQHSFLDQEKAAVLLARWKLDGPAYRPDIEALINYLLENQARLTKENADLKNQAHRFETFLENSQDAIVITDELGVIDEWNKEAEALFGLPARDALGKKIWDVQFQLAPDEHKTPERLEQLKNVFLTILKTGIHPWLAHPNDSIVQRPDGYRQAIQSKVFVSSTPGGVMLGSITRDTTQRKQMEEALRKSEDRFRSLFVNMTEGVALHELVYSVDGKAIDYRILDTNPAFSRYTGIEMEDAVGRLATQIYGPIPPYLDDYAEVTTTGQPYSFETYYEPMQKYFQISVFSPQPGQFATVFEDITGRKLKEQELRERDDDVTRFTYAVSHDLKSPLVTIKGFLGYLETDIKEQKTDRIAKDLEYIRNAADKMSKLLDELLELSQMGRRKNPPVEVPLQTIIQEAEDLVAGRITARSIRIKVTPEPVILLGDRQRLVQMYQNLLDNAAKYMGVQSEPQIEIGVQKKEHELVLFVRDNGIGVDPRHQKNLFDLFEKIEPSSEGTGIGLAVVKRIVEIHGGKIWAESEGIGKGSTFYFTLDGTRLEQKNAQGEDV